MQNNTTKIVAAVIAILAIGGIATFATSGNKPKDQMVKDSMSKSSEIPKDIMLKKDETMKKAEIMINQSMTKTSDVMIKKDEGKMMQKDAMTKTSDVGMQKESDTMSKDDASKKAEVSSPSGMYSQYSVNNLAQNSTGTNVIFFHAPWCPSCRSVDAEINANLDKLPENFQVLKADFDTSTELKKKYGVTGQSTFVKVDKDGNKVGTVSPQFQLKTVADIVAFGQK